MTDDDPVIAVHLLILWEPVCHSCGWSGGGYTRVANADKAADIHECEGE